MPRFRRLGLYAAAGVDPVLGATLGIVNDEARSFTNHKVIVGVAARLHDEQDRRLTQAHRLFVRLREDWVFEKPRGIEGGGYESTRETPEGSGARALDQMHELE